MINKKILFLHFIILLLFTQFIISYSLNFYNKKFKINFNIENFEEKFFNFENKNIAYYERKILNNNSNLENIIVFIHSPFESSLNSNYTLSNTFKLFNDSSNNYKIILIDLPAHGKSFKEDNYDYSFRNVSSYLLKLLEDLNLKNINLICDKFSSSIALNMISLNDKIFSNIILINPIFNYNANFENIKFLSKNKFSYINSFILLNLTKTKKDLYFKNYVTNFFNNKNSSNKYARKMIKESTPLSFKDVSPENINIFALITNRNYFKESYLKHLSNNFSTVFFLPEELIQKIIKR